MIIDKISFNEHDYLLVSFTTETYKLKLMIVKVKRGKNYQRFRVDSPDVEILKVDYTFAGKRRLDKADKAIEKMKKKLNDIVLEEAVKAVERANNFIKKGDDNGDIK